MVFGLLFTRWQRGGLGPDDIARPVRAIFAIGRSAAVAELPRGTAFAGTLGWLAWLVAHLMFLIGYRNRAVVLG